MTPIFELKHCLGDLKTEKLVKNCRLRLTVRWCDTGWFEKHFFYCLHCKKVFSRTGFYYHKFTFTLTPQEVEVLLADLISNRTRHDLLLKREFERRFENGKMRRVAYAQPTVPQTITFTPQHFLFQRPPPMRLVRPHVPRPRVVESVHENVEPQHEDQPIDVFEEVQQDFPELFDCFSNKGFDPSRFEDYIKDFFSHVSEPIEKKRLRKTKRRRRR